MLDSAPHESLADQIPSQPCNAPETRLLLAVLHDALETFQRGLHTCDGKNREAFREVDRWFRSSEYDWPFSFENICSTLLVDADRIRDGLNQLRTSALTKRTVKKKRMVVRERFCNHRAWNAPLGQ